MDLLQLAFNSYEKVKLLRALLEFDISKRLNLNDPFQDGNNILTHLLKGSSLSGIDDKVLQMKGKAESNEMESLAIDLLDYGVNPFYVGVNPYQYGEKDLQMPCISAVEFKKVKFLQKMLSLGLLNKENLSQKNIDDMFVLSGSDVSDDIRDVLFAAGLRPTKMAMLQNLKTLKISLPYVTWLLKKEIISYQDTFNGSSLIDGIFSIKTPTHQLIAAHLFKEVGSDDKDMLFNGLLTLLKKGKTSEIKKYINNTKIDLNYTPPNNDTLLMAALKMKSRVKARVLIEKGADPFAKNGGVSNISGLIYFLHFSDAKEALDILDFIKKKGKWKNVDAISMMANENLDKSTQWFLNSDDIRRLKFTIAPNSTEIDFIDSFSKLGCSVSAITKYANDYKISLSQIGPNGDHIGISILKRLRGGSYISAFPYDDEKDIHGQTIQQSLFSLIEVNAEVRSQFSFDRIRSLFQPSDEMFWKSNIKAQNTIEDLCCRLIFTDDKHLKGLTALGEITATVCNGLKMIKQILMSDEDKLSGEKIDELREVIKSLNSSGVSLPIEKIPASYTSGKEGLLAEISHLILTIMVSSKPEKLKKRI